MRAELQAILDAVDYTSGACLATQMVGSVLDKQLIINARIAIREDIEREKEDPRLANLKRRSDASH